MRQFHQIGVEAFGMDGPDVDAELLMLTARLWHELGILDAVTLQLNTLGNAADRARFKDDLVVFLSARKDQLDEDSQRRLDSNPLRILDSKSASTQTLLNDAPRLIDYIDQESIEHFEQLKALLDAAGIAYEINPRLVRGLDYYGKTVFEWVTDRLGAQGTVCAGGRYDGLVEQLGGRPVPAVGFAMGIERLVLLLQELDVIPAAVTHKPDVYFIVEGDVAAEALKVSEVIRSEIPWLRLLTHCGGGKFKRQMKKAVDSGASLALLINEDTAAEGQLTIKYLQEEKEQQTLAQAEIIELMQAAISE
jgi:histidyl-tRNA synthetase